MSRAGAIAFVVGFILLCFALSGLIEYTKQKKENKRK